jgi:hypothetical protein
MRMSNLKERVSRIERALEGEEPEDLVLVIREIGTEADLRELPDNDEQWLTWPAAWEQRDLPHWPGGPIIVCLSSEAERAARVRTAEGQEN